MPRIVVIPAPVFVLPDDTVEVGRMLEAHLETVLAVDDEWKDLIQVFDDADLVLKLKMNILDAISGCITGIGNTCPAVVLHRSDIGLLWLADDGSVRFLSVKEMVRRREILYATTPAVLPEDARLFRLQTYKPLEPDRHRFFSEQFENLELEFYESLYGSRDLERWRKIMRVTALPAIARAVAEVTRRFVMELCIFGEYNVCPGVLLLSGDRVDVKILKISAKAENYVARIDLAGLLASNR